jgi:hypothetical protein
MKKFIVKQLNYNRLPDPVLDIVKGNSREDILNNYPEYNKATILVMEISDEEIQTVINKAKEQINRAQAKIDLYSKDV